MSLGRGSTPAFVGWGSDGEMDRDRGSDWRAVICMASPMPRRCSTISPRRCLAASAPLRRAPGSRLLRMVNQAGRPCCESGSVPDSHSTAEDQEIPPGRGIAPRPGGPGQHSDAVPLRPSPPPAARGNPPPCHTYLRV